MTSKEFEVEEDQSEPFTSVSDRDNLYIIHRGQPPKEHSPFGKVSTKPRWPEKLWTSGQLVYSIKSKEACLGPPTSPDDITLRFDSRFESGNLAKALKLTNDSYHLILEYDHNETGTCQWFYFRVSNVRTTMKYTFYISGFHKETSLFSTGLKCFMYSEKRARKEGISWVHCGSNYSYSVTSRTKFKGKRATVQFRTRFPYDDDVCYLCYALPYTYSDLLHNIHLWSLKAKPGVFQSEILCQSLCGRDVPVLSITSPDSHIPLAGKSCIFLTGRIHPGESNGSFVLHGLIDFLLSDDPIAKYILDYCIVRIVPMLGVDGVVEGSYRVSLMGHDLNRMWTNPNPVLHPEIWKTKNLIAQTAMERPVIVYIDFHGHSSLHGTFAYGCPNTGDAGLRDTEKTLPRLYAFLSDAFSWEHCVFTFPKDRKDAGRIVVRREMGVVQSFTIETSFGGVKAGPYAGMLYDEILWKMLGASCGEAIYHLLIPTASPLFSYVNKELVYFMPNSGKNEKKTEEEKEEVPVRLNEATDDKEVDLAPILKEGMEGHKLRVKKPDSFFKFDVSQIDTKPPKEVVPKWKLMEFNA